MQNNTNIHNTLYINYLNLFNIEIKCHNHTLSYLWSATKSDTDMEIECHINSIKVRKSENNNSSNQVSVKD